VVGQASAHSRDPTLLSNTPIPGTRAGHPPASARALRPVRLADHRWSLDRDQPSTPSVLGVGSTIFLCGRRVGAEGVELDAKDLIYPDREIQQIIRCLVRLGQFRSGELIKVHADYCAPGNGDSEMGLRQLASESEGIPGGLDDDQMGLRFVGIDPNTGGDNCPAVFVDEETGDLVFQGSKVTDSQMLAQVASHSPIADHESVVRLSARMKDIIVEAARDSEGPSI
jgi:hypothetical protein